MLNPELIPDQVLTDILDNLDLPDSEESYKRVKSLSVGQAFEHFLEQRGFFGYSALIMNALDGLREAEMQEQPAETTNP